MDDGGSVGGSPLHDCINRRNGLNGSHSRRPIPLGLGIRSSTMGKTSELPRWVEQCPWLGDRLPIRCATHLHARPRPRLSQKPERRLRPAMANHPSNYGLPCRGCDVQYLPRQTITISRRHLPNRAHLWLFRLPHCLMDHERAHPGQRCLR